MPPAQITIDAAKHKEDEADNGRFTTGVLTMDDIHTLMELFIIGGFAFFGNDDETVEEEVILYHILIPTIAF